MPTAALTPKSVVHHRPLSAKGAPVVPPRIARASRMQKSTSAASPSLSKEPADPYHRQVGWITLILGMLLMLTLVLLGQFAFTFSETIWNDLHYGRPRLFQTDAFVGHETGSTPSHFIALNLRGRIEVIELPGGDPARSQIYQGPQLYGPGADLVPVTLQFRAQAPTHDTRHPDMFILFQSTQIVLHNIQGTFKVQQ